MPRVQPSAIRDIVMKIDPMTATSDDFQRIYDEIAKPRLDAIADPDDATSVNERRRLRKERMNAQGLANAVKQLHGVYQSEERKAKLYKAEWEMLLAARQSLLDELEDPDEESALVIRLALSMAFDFYLCEDCQELFTEVGEKEVDRHYFNLMTLEIRDETESRECCPYCESENVRKPGFDHDVDLVRIPPEVEEKLREVAPFYRYTERGFLFYLNYMSAREESKRKALERHEGQLERLGVEIASAL